MHRGTQLSEVIKELGQRGLGNVSIALTGIITSLDPKTYTAKVLLGMNGVETGWLPMGTILAGNGYGIVAIPEINTEVTVLFENGDLNAGKIVLSNFNKTDPPPPGLNPGEIYAQSKGNASIKLDANGGVTINTTSGDVTVNQASGGNIKLVQGFRGGSITLQTDAVIINNPDPLKPGELRNRTTL